MSNQELTNIRDRLRDLKKYANCAAGPWVPGPPVGGNCYDPHLGDIGGFGIKIIRKDGDDWVTDDDFDFSDDEILHHAVINPPGGGDDNN